MGDSPSPPAAPDPIATATGQAQANVETAIANTALGNANVYSPLGTSTYQQIGTTSITMPDGTSMSVPRYENTVNLAPQEQQLFNQETANQASQGQIEGNLLGNVDQSLATPIASPNLQTSYNPGASVQTSLGNTDFSADRDAATNAVLQRLQPGMDQQTAGLQSQLANQGVAQGSAAWNAAMLSNAQGQNDLRLGAVQAGDQEQEALYNEALSSSQFANQGQQQQNSQNAAAATFGNQSRLSQYQADLQNQDQSLNMLSALGSGSQVNMPQFAGYQGGTVGQTPYSQDVYASANLNEQNYQSEVQQNEAMMSGLFGLGSKMFGLFGMSDRRLKRDVVRLGRMPNGLALYSWHYLWGGAREVGFMADEVAAAMPDAVAVHPSGFLMVDYGRAAA